MTEMFVILLQEQIVEEIYPAEMAQLSNSMFVASRGIVIKVSGYNEKLHVSVCFTLSTRKNVALWLSRF